MFSERLECNDRQKGNGCCGEDVFVDETGHTLSWDLISSADGEWIGTKNSIEFKIAYSESCGGTATRVQTGSAQMTFTTHPGTVLVLSMQGKAESEYESFELFVDGKSEVFIQASDSDTCEVNTCNMCDVAMPEREMHLGDGTHTIRIEVDTIDQNYHHDAYFKIFFSIKEKDGCSNCKCTPPGIEFDFNIFST